MVLRDGLEPPSPDYKTGILAFEITEHKLGGGRGNRTLLVSNLARVTRSPLLPPISKHTTHLTAQLDCSAVCLLIGSVCGDRTHLIID